MFNRERTLEVFNYDIDLNKRSRRSDEEYKNTGLKKNLKVIDNCPLCNEERQITLRASRNNKMCLKCFHNSPEMIRIKQNQNKVKSEVTKQKMRQNHWSKDGMESPFKGHNHTELNKSILAEKQTAHMVGLSASQKRNRYIKSSCSFRGISEQDFDGWSTPESLRIRGSSEYKQWEQKVYERDQHCRFPYCLEKRKNQLVAHHKDGFNWALDRRFDVDNGVILCKYHHNHGPNSFHSKYGNGDNTEAQFAEWIDSNIIVNSIKRDLYLVTGAPGSGKSWVCSQLASQVDYIPYDDVPKEQHLHLMLNNNKLPIVYDPWRKATSFVKRYAANFNIKLIVIVEDLEVVKKRLIQRGGVPDDNTNKYVKRSMLIAKKAEFSGTSDQVLQYLKDKLYAKV
jgi:hypothetical protein